MGQQEPKRHAGFELLGVGCDCLAVVGGGGILVVGRILHIAEIEESPGIAGIVAEVLHQQRPGALEILLLDLAFSCLALGWRLGGVRWLGVWYMSTWWELILGCKGSRQQRCRE